VVLKGVHKAGVRRDIFTTFALGEGDIEAVENTNPHLRGNGIRSSQERKDVIESRQEAQDVPQSHAPLSDRDPSLALRPRDGMGDFQWIEVRAMRLVLLLR
jgi:hypothetical protein